jgi:hypothetical protein
MLTAFTGVLAAVFGGAAVPILWILGLILLVIGVVALFNGSALTGAVLIIIGILLGALNVF